MAEKTEVAAGRPKPKVRATTAAPAQGASTSVEDGPQRVSGVLTPAAPASSAPAAPASKPAGLGGFFRRLGGSSEQASTPAAAATPTKGEKATTGTAAATKGEKAPAGAAAATPQRPQMGKFFFGMMLYMVLAFAAQLGLGYVFQFVPGKGQQVLFSLPLLGNVTQYLFAWMLVLIVILWGLYKLKILPRTLGNPPPRTAAAKADAKAAPKPAEPKPPREPLSGPDDAAYQRVKARLRSERRRARRH